LVFRDSTKQDITAKDIVLSLNGQPTKYDQVIPILENNKGKPFLQQYCAIKREQTQVKFNNDGKLE
jgi:hypothetical protein